MSQLQPVQENYTKPYAPDDIEETKSYLTELNLEDIVDRAIDSYKLNFGGDDFHYFNYGYNRNFSNIPEFGANRSGTLTVTNVDLQVKVNGRAHRTNRFGISKSRVNPLLVVRRGQAFSVNVTLSRAYDEKNDDLIISFKAGQYGNHVNGTLVEFPLSAQIKPRSWGARLTNKQGNVLTLDIFTPSTCYIGKWTLMIDVIKKHNRRTNVLRYQHKDPIYVIFNPWSHEDSVYMSNEQHLDEYVLNESGVIFQGPSNLDVVQMDWYYGQFESPVLDVAMYLLDIGRLNWENRGNPILIARKISALVNSNDDDGGIVYGMWGTKYPGGIHPSAWTGSVEILKQYWSTQRAVKYGQCWVFSGVTTTICRALGIPTRSITNFESAHDSDGSITIKLEYDAKGKFIARPGGDSLWNFHCWNECYMSRPDLPSGYGGWQVFDATPQEASDGLKRLGPVPVSAIKEGEVHIPYDGPFVFSEVNGDVYSLKPNKNGVMEIFDVSINRCGTLICCKAVGSNYIENLTSTYKYPEGSPEERATVLKVNQNASSTRYMLEPKIGQKDATFTVVNDVSKNLLGSVFTVGLNIKNTSSSKHTCSGTISSRSVYYTGAVGHEIKTLPFKNIVFNPGEVKTIDLTILPEEYTDKLVDRSIIDVSFLSEIEETDQKFATKESFSLRSPPLIIRAPGEGRRNKEFTVELSFTNPLNLNLSNCVVVVDGICHAVRFPVGDVAPHANFRTTVQVTPCRSGKRELIAAFDSNNLHGITASQLIFINK